jgi:methylthioribose-1-phosphate isomerase
MVETMRWTKGRLDLLDQTLLPEKVIYRPLRTVREVTDAIRNMLVRGRRAPCRKRR